MPRRNPPVVPADTSPAAWRHHMDGIARRTVQERLEEWATFNRDLGNMEAAGVRHRHPDYDDRQVFLAVVRRRYGDDLVRAAWPHDELVDP